MSNENQKPSNWVIKTPKVLRAACGFISAITSCVITVIFSLTIYESVLKVGWGYPNAFKIGIMIIGPLVSCLQFVNVSSTLSALFATNEKKEEEGKTVIEDPAVVVATPEKPPLEHQLYGSTTVLLRAIAGFSCSLVICFASLMFTYVIHQGTINEKMLPSELEMLVVVAGPILTSWSFMKAETTIRNLLQIDGVREILRKKAIDVLSKSK